MTDLRKLIDELNEASRYVRKNPDVVRGAIDRVDSELVIAPWQNCKTDRLRGNLYFARNHLNVEPDVCRGYILGAAFELNIQLERMK